MRKLANVINSLYRVAIYIRLSREDLKKTGSNTESESIINQRSLLYRYIEENGYNLVDEYVDDGYSGTNFDRPEFQRMLKDIENGKINMVITKDMSRLGRDYIGTGEYMEKYFPTHNVRYIAVTDDIDTAVDTSNNDIAPFKALFNDLYAKDISKKIVSSLRTKQKDGKWVGGCTPFGYIQSPENKNQLIVCEEEAWIVKEIFKLALSGMGTYKIKEYLIQNNIPTPSMIRGSRGNTSQESLKGIWSPKTVKGILTNELYTGDLIQNRRSRINYKIKKTKYNPREEWIIVENTHEAIVDKSTFNSIQKMLAKTSNRNIQKEKRTLDGLLFCYECKHKLSICAPRKSDNRTYIVCNYYRMNSKRNVCTSHSFNYDYLERGVFNIIKEMCKKCLDLEKTSNKIAAKCQNDNNEQLTKDKIIKLQNEIERLTINLDRMYIDKLDGKIDDEMYTRISANLKQELFVKNNNLEELFEIESNFQDDKFTSEECKKIINDFLNNDKMTREMALKLINKIEIHKDKKIDIYFNFKELNFLKTNS